jgi:hypothetical protein
MNGPYANLPDDGAATMAMDANPTPFGKREPLSLLSVHGKIPLAFFDPSTLF